MPHLKRKQRHFKSTCLFITLEGIPRLEEMCRSKLQDTKLAGKVTSETAQKLWVRLVFHNNLLQPNKHQHFTSPAFFDHCFANADVEPQVTLTPSQQQQQQYLNVLGCAGLLQSLVKLKVKHEYKDK